jgi:hypothetical protein
MGGRIMAYKNYTRETVDTIVTDSEGNERWYVMHEVAGVDEDGYYELVLDGPASGEKVYLDE